MNPRVLIIILCYNGIDLTLDCIASLYRQDYGDADILVIDNASYDQTPSIVRARFPHITVIETGSNLGFAAGNNIGIRYALSSGYDYIFLLNNDTIVAENTLSTLIKTIEQDPSIGIAGPTILFHCNSKVIWSAGGIIDWKRGTSYMRGINMVDGDQFDILGDVDFVSGCGLLVRSTALKHAGIMDDRFGMYYEETEWCVRINRAGWRIVHVPQARMWHKIDPAKQDLSPRITYYMTRNRLLFLRLTRAPLRAWAHALLFQDLRTWCSWRIRRRWKGRAAQRVALLQGWRDFLHNRFGMIE